MKTIIHDLDNFKLNDNYYVVDAKKCKNSCMGCFSCWIKHPKICCIKDEFNNVPDMLKDSDELIIISKNRYGTYSSCVKRVIERCIGYLLPYFYIKDKDKKMHHVPRYDKQIILTTIFYGDIEEEDKKCLCNLVKANSLNFDASSYNVYFYKDIEEIKNVYFN